MQLHGEPGWLHVIAATAVEQGAHRSQQRMPDLRASSEIQTIW